jgi:hypothetical protein
MKQILWLFVSFSLFFFDLNGQIDFKNKQILRELKAFEQPVQLEPLTFENISSWKSNFFQLKDSQNIRGYLYIGRLKCFGSDSYVLRQDNNDEFEYFDYFAIFDLEIVLQKISIFNYQASYGAEITSKNWLKQFKGYSGSPQLIVGKNVDAISGATSSVEAFTKNIEEVTTALRKAKSTK